MDNFENTQPLYDVIKSAIKDGELPDSFSLPRDPSEKVPFADGAMDGISIWHMGAPEITDEIRALIKNAVDAAAAGNNIKQAEEAFGVLAEKISALRAIDELQSYIIENRNTLPANNLYNFAVNMALRSPNKDSIKFGLSILELLNIENNEELKNAVRTLGLCDEFTIFAVFIMLQWGNGNEEIFELAKRVHGWGRIHAVERLEPETDEIKKWLLREGYKNVVLPAYSALTCWNKSGAAELLRSGEPLSNKDFKGFCGLFDALLDEGPCAGISEVENADEMLELFLNRASGRELDIDDYEVVRNIRDYDGENGKVAALCSDIIKSEKCRERVKLAVKDGKAIELANELGIDCRADILSLLETDIEKHRYLCAYLMDDTEYRVKVIALFGEKLPLDEMKSAPTMDMGLGVEFKKQQCLDAIVQYLDKYPLEGIDLIETALQCAPVRNRHMALRALRSWVNAKQTPLEQLLPETFALLQRLKEIEPDEEDRETMASLLNGETE